MHDEDDVTDYAQNIVPSASGRERARRLTYHIVDAKNYTARIKTDVAFVRPFYSGKGDQDEHI